MSTSFSSTRRKKSVSSPASGTDGGSGSCLPSQLPTCHCGVAGLTSGLTVSGQRQAGELCAGQACSVPPGWDCHNHCFLDLQVLTALSVPLRVAAACAGVTHFKPRLTSKESSSMPMLLVLNSLSKRNCRMSQ